MQHAIRTDWYVSTAPTEEPVTLIEAKNHLRVDHGDDDSLISALLQAAREWCEGYQGRAYMQRTITLKLDTFYDMLELPDPPLVSVTSVQYVDTDGNTQTLGSTYYTVDTTSEPGRIHLAYNQTWPQHRDIPHAVTITFVAGYSSRAAVPARFKAAIKLLLGHLYEHREVVTELALKKVPMAVESLLNIDRVECL